MRQLFICHDNSIDSFLKARFDDDFKSVDRLFISLIFGFYLIALLITPWLYGYFTLGFIGGGIFTIIALFAYKFMSGSVWCRCTLVVCMIGFMAIFAQQANGKGEGYFVFFAFFAALARYRDIVPVILAVVVTIIQHSVTAYCQYIGLEVFGSAIFAFSWGSNTALGLFTPLLYHVVWVLVMMTVVVYLLNEGISKFVETSYALEMVEAGSKGDLSRTMDYHSSTTVIEQVNQFFININNVLRQTSKIAETVSVESIKTTVSSKELNKIAIDQQNNSQMVFESVEQLTIATSEIAKNAEATASDIHQAVNVSNEGHEVMKTTQESLLELNRKTNQARSIIKDLENESQQINSIVATIRGISEQTNLLALNAAIEAARAGEYGRGFAVVADEVRVLSQRTHDSTAEITRMITSLQSTTEAAVDIMKSCDELSSDSVNNAQENLQNFALLTSKIDEINAMAGQIAIAAEQQSSVTGEIKQNMSHVNSISNQFYNETNANLENSEKLNSESDTLNDLLKQFKFRVN